jgi:hypothetical protein
LERRQIVKGFLEGFADELSELPEAERTRAKMQELIELTMKDTPDEDFES